MRELRVRASTGRPPVQRLRVTIRGAVQGVGFRPFVYRLATDLGLVGWVSNTAQGLFIEVEGAPAHLEEFLRRLDQERPPRAALTSLETVLLEAAGFSTFEIRASDANGAKTTLMLPDIATCPDCLREIFDPANRRFGYPFTNCTNCGPRFSIIEALPYDRPNTTMRHFDMCADCRAEYENPLDRRFHAQPIACPRCGPRLALWDRAATVLATDDEVLRQAADAIREGAIVAVKGLGGFQLLVDARNGDAVQELRRRKHREEKPFALMYPALTLAAEHCEVSAAEAELLTSPEAPIVLLRRRRDAAVATAVAPRNPYLGVMLPYTPLHHLLMAELGFPVVATSGNLAEEPIVTDERVALERLGGIADLFLVHERPIARHVDDSVARVVLGRPLLLRRARGYAPLPVPLRTSAPLLAVGGHLKNVTALAVDGNVFLSQHIGTLETRQAYDAFVRVIADFGRIYEIHPAAVACDGHPDYRSTQYAERSGLPVIRVQHHYAHVLAAMAEHDLEAPVLGVAWDGTGDGMDGTVWGGEFLRVTDDGFRRIAAFRAFPLPGGEQAVREPRRSAAGLLFPLHGDALFDMTDLPPVADFSAQERRIVAQMLARGVNSPRTSSVGRLFDAVAALLGLRQRCTFEGQAAMELEFLADGVVTDEAYDIPLRPGESGAPEIVVDWEPMVQAIVAEICRGEPAARIAARFHNTLVESIVAVARRADEERVLLTGGCFQNAYLLERAVRRLRGEGFRPYWPQRVPPNDGGLALGQVLAAVRALRKE